MRNTKIIATLGPSSRSQEIMKKLLSVPVDVFRINASHGTHLEHEAQIVSLRQLGGDLDIHPCILLDLQGPKIRLGRFQGGGAVLKSGSRFVITAKQVIGSVECASASYPNLSVDVTPGDRLVLADGAVELRALATEDSSIICVVTSGGVVRDHQGINLPQVKLTAPSLTPKDLTDLEFGLKNHVDLVGLSFVRGPSDILHLRQILAAKCSSMPIISKIERLEACENLDAIIEASDGVMVARGDLGVEVSLQKVPALQKTIIERSRRLGRFVVTATQMLESMTSNPTPTRAEVSDVANAIFDRTDALMLSAETATGEYPVEAARMMASIASEVEGFDGRIPALSLPKQSSPNHAHIIADACCRAAQAPEIRGIVVFTTTGATARLVAQCRPAVPTFAFVPTEAVLRSLAVVYGVRAFRSINAESAYAMTEASDRVLVREGCVKPNDSVIVLTGEPNRNSGICKSDSASSSG
jgi:pyruvate kinase